MTSRMLFAVAAAATFGAVPAGAQDVPAGETLYQEVCKNCHGPKAQGMASFPKLVGNDAEYLTMRLEQYRTGEKVGPNSALMTPMATDLSDEEIANLVTYITTGIE